VTLSLLFISFILSSWSALRRYIPGNVIQCTVEQCVTHPDSLGFNRSSSIFYLTSVIFTARLLGLLVDSLFSISFHHEHFQNVACDVQQDTGHVLGLLITGKYIENQFTKIARLHLLWVLHIVSRYRHSYCNTKDWYVYNASVQMTVAQTSHHLLSSLILSQSNTMQWTKR
jgi:hypothetical protein